MAQITSNVKKITSGTTPTTTTLDLGELAFGTVNGRMRIYGNSSGAVQEITTDLSGYLPLSGGTLTGNLITRAITPAADNNVTFGSSTNRYSQGFILVTNSNTVRPIVSSGSTIGSTALPYATGYVTNLYYNNSAGRYLKDTDLPSLSNYVTFPDIFNDGTSKTRIQLGLSASATGTNSVAIGNGAIATAGQSVAVGLSSNTTSTYSVAVGARATTKSSYGIAIGAATSADNGTTAGGYSVAIGSLAKTESTSSIVIGRSSTATVNNAVALGYNSSVAASGGLAIGYGSTLLSSDYISGTDTSGYAPISFGSSTVKRRIINVANGVNNYDVVNLRQLNQYLPLSGGEMRGIIQTYALIPASTSLRPNLGATDRFYGTGYIDNLYYTTGNASTSDQKYLKHEDIHSYNVIGSGITITYYGGILIGREATSSLVGSGNFVSIGSNSVCNVAYGVALGGNASVNLNYGGAIGYNSEITANDVNTADSSQYRPISFGKSTNNTTKRRLINVAPGIKDNDVAIFSQISSNIVFSELFGHVFQTPTTWQTSKANFAQRQGTATTDVINLKPGQYFFARCYVGTVANNTLVGAFLHKVISTNTTTNSITYQMLCPFTF